MDLVVVSLPNHLHREAVLAAAAAGKAVACTKPLGRNAAEAADMLRAVRAAGVWSAYLENVVFNLDVMRMRQMIEAGSIGRVTTVRAREGHSGPHAAHFWDAELAGGGALLDMASHGTEVARYLLGKDVAAREVFAWGDTLVHGARTSGEDNAVMVIRFEDGRAATCDVSWSSRGGLEGRFEVYGDAGRMVHDMGTGSIRAVIERPAAYIGEKADAETGWVLPDPRRGPRPRPRRDDGRRDRELPRRPGARRDVRRRLRRETASATRRTVPAIRPVGARRRRPGSPPDDVPAAGLARAPMAAAAHALLDRLATTQAEALEQASRWCADAIAADGLVHLSAPGIPGSRSRRCSPATGRTRASTRSSSCR